MKLVQAIKIVGNEMRKSYPEFSDGDAVDYARRTLSLPNTGGGAWEIYEVEGEPEMFQAFKMVLKARPSRFNGNLECSLCGQVKPDARLRDDTYAQDVNNEEDAKHIACDECDLARCQDI